MINKRRIIGGGIRSNQLQQIIAQSYTEDFNDIGDYVVIKATPEIQLYINKNIKHVIISNRGSKTKEDYLLDWRLIADDKVSSRRTKDLETVIKLVRNKFPDYKITSIGHSLGGYLASRFADLVDEVIGVNSYIPPGSIYKTIPDKETLVKSTGDIPSLLSDLQKRKNVVKIKAQDNTTQAQEHSYDILKRLPESLFIGTPNN